MSQYVEEQHARQQDPVFEFVIRIHVPLLLYLLMVDGPIGVHVVRHVVAVLRMTPFLPLFYNNITRLCGVV
jgi:hypothetical protein